MKILFVHDHKFKHKDNDYFSSGGLPASIWPRYLSVFDVLTVVGRDGGILTDDIKGFTLSSAERVDFCLLPNISNAYSFFFGNSAVDERCRDLLLKHDGVIARLPSRLGKLFVDEAIRQGKPYAVEVVGCPWDVLWNYGTLQAKLFAPIAAYSLKKMVAKAPFALYVTENFLQNRYPCIYGKTTFCSNAEIPEVPVQVLENRLSKITQTSAKTVFGLIGNYSSMYKGVHVAIRALALIKDKLPNWEFHIVGSGNPRIYIELAKKLGVVENVRFIGSIPAGESVCRWLDTVDIYLQPSLQEGLPRALLEAMSHGCPSIASKTGGIPELLLQSQMIEPGDYKALSIKLLQLVYDKKLLLNLANKNFSKAQNYYKPILDERRTSFWHSYKKAVENDNLRCRV